ncbi:MAG: CD15/CS22/SEF14 family fimbrial major subunit, partial [Pseudomonadota bacterium]
MTPIEYAQAVISARQTGYRPGDTIGFSFLTQADFDATDYSFLWGNDVAKQAVITRRFLSGFTPFSDEQKEAVREVFKLIESVTDLRFVELSPGDSGPRIRFGNTLMPGDGGVSLRDSSFSAGIGWQTRINDILISRDNTSIQRGSFGFATLIHEIGHALGLKHPHDVEPGRPALAGVDSEITLALSTMSYEDSPAQPDEFGITPLLLDIAALQELYGRRSAAIPGNAFSEHFGDTTYTFLPIRNDRPRNLLTLIERDQIKAIWDGGGSDIFDASAFDRQAEIRLSESELSSIGAGVSVNIAVAFGSQIENAIGGTQGDLLIGNDLPNRLEGRSGADTIIAGAGNDALQGGRDTDTLEGGADFDTYVYAAGDGADTIRDSDASGQITVGGMLLDGSSSKPFLSEHNRLAWESNGGTVRYTLVRGDLTTGGVLEITGSALGGAGDKITIEDFRLASATSSFLSLTLNQDGAASLRAGVGANPYRDPDFAAAGSVTTFTEGEGRSFQVARNTAGKSGERVQLALAGPNADKFSAVIGGDTISFAGGPVEIPFVEGQNQVAFALLQQGDVDADAALTLTATIVSTDPNFTPVASNTVTVNLDAFEEGADTPGTTYTITGDQVSGPGSSTDAYGNIVNGVPAPGRNDFLNGSPANDRIEAL